MYDFNTSNVTIQHRKRVEPKLILLYFNTSNVTIQHQCKINNSTTYHDFNTSNVTIQHILYKRRRSYKEISIHLMLLFNLIYFLLLNFKLNFNTSNVTIQLTILSHLFYSQFHYTHYISTFS